MAGPIDYATPEFLSPIDVLPHSRLDVSIQGTASGPQGAIANDQFSYPDQFLSGDFSVGAGGWLTQDGFPRYVADANGDGFNDIVGLGHSGVMVSFGSADGSFTPGGLVLVAYGQSQGWHSIDLYPRFLVDVDGDGVADIVDYFFKDTDVKYWSTDGHFNSGPVVTFSDFSPVQGWSTQDAFPRTVGDVNADGKIDLVGFGYAGTLVALNRGGYAFRSAKLAVDDFGVDQGWTSDNLFHRTLADVNGDGAEDIVGFGYAGTLVALANGDGTFASPHLALDDFGQDQGWSSQDRFPRQVADVNGDGRADIVGFGIAGTYVAYGYADGIFSPARLDIRDFTATQGWTSNNIYPRILADINNDGLADIVGFGASGVLAAYNQGGWHI